MPAVRVVDIKIYRDGGSIEFKIQKHGTTAHIWLDSPFRGERRRLLIDGQPATRGDEVVFRLLADVDTWWRSMPADQQKSALKALAHTCPFRNPTPEERAAIDLSRVLRVREYVARHYAEEKQG